MTSLCVKIRKISAACRLCCIFEIHSLISFCYIAEFSGKNFIQLSFEIFIKTEHTNAIKKSDNELISWLIMRFLGKRNHLIR